MTQPDEVKVLIAERNWLAEKLADIAETGWSCETHCPIFMLCDDTNDSCPAETVAFWLRYAKAWEDENE